MLVLSDTCDVQDDGVDTEPYGQSADPRSTLTAQPGRLVTHSQTIGASFDGEAVVTTTYRWLCRPDVVIEAGYTLHNITLADGTAMAESFRVTGVVLKRSKLMRLKRCDLELIK